MSEQNPDPDPDTTPDLGPGGSPPAGGTPPAEGSTSEAGPEETHNPTKGWAAGPVLALLVVVALVAAFFLAYGLLILTGGLDT